MERLSLYTYLFESGGNFYLYNSESNLFCSINKDLYQKLFDCDFENINPHSLDFLIKKKVIIQEEHLYDYYETAKIEFFSNINNREKLNLIIAPTAGCNFSCPYCFEGIKNNIVIKDELIDDIVNFINRYERLNEINITWYGGEPLIAFSKIKKILSKIKKECQATIKSQSIVTNGYLITDEVILFMKENKFDSIQITLDGTEYHHNSTRYLKDNHSPTYKRIITNIDKLVKDMPDYFKLSIRVNVNKNNQEDYIILYQMFSEKYSKKKVHVYPGFIRETRRDGKKMCYQSLYSGAEYEFYKQLYNRDIRKDLFPKHTAKGCMTCDNQSFIIGPSGELYKCWNDFNNPLRSIGNIKDNKLTNPTLVSRYLYETTIYNEPKCKNCLLFPVCDGGCAWYRYKNIYENCNFDLCSYLADYHKLEECLLTKLSKNPQ